MGCLRRLVGAVVVLVVLGIATVFALGYFASHQSCTVGLTNSAVNVTVEGPSATYQCGTFTGNGQGWFVYTAGAQPTGTVLCQVVLAGDTVTVRDQGLTDALGRTWCVALQRMATATVAP